MSDLIPAGDPPDDAPVRLRLTRRIWFPTAIALLAIALVATTAILMTPAADNKPQSAPELQSSPIPSETATGRPKLPSAEPSAEPAGPQGTPPPAEAPAEEIPSTAAAGTPGVDLPPAVIPEETAPLAITGFAVDPQLVPCSVGTTEEPGVVNSPLTFTWSSVGAVTAWIGIDTLDAEAEPMAGPLPPDSGELRDLVFECYGSHDYTLTVVDNQGLKASATLRVTNNGDVAF